MSDATEIESGLAALKVMLLASVAADKKPKAKGFENLEAKIEWSGKKIILPDDPARMTHAQAIEWHQRMQKAEEEVISFSEVIDAYPWDGAVAFMKAMQRIYGWATPVPTRGFFGPSSPTMVSIDIGYRETATIFWGGFKVPGIEAEMACSVHMDNDGQPMFVIQGRCKRKYLEAIHTLAELTRQIVLTESIYRGKAIKLIVNNDGDIDWQKPPKFIDTSKVDESELVFSDHLMDQVVTNLFTPIEHTQLCRDNKVPLKRGVLLEGPFGTGKTMLASIVSKLCERHGWTFITVPRVTALEAALQFAARYQRAVVFVEDIDREMAGERTAKMDDILNTVDGIVSKGTEIMVVLTTNDVTKINRAMLRPGRLDAVLRIDPPDAKAAAKLVRVYGGKLIRPTDELVECGKELAGQIPAVIRECVERSKLYAIAQRPGEPFVLTDADVARSAVGMRAHLDLLKVVVPGETPAEQLASSLGSIINEKLGDFLPSGLSKKINKLVEQIEELHNHIL